MSADVAGYSRLMGLDEAGTARILREHRAIADAMIAKHGGRIVKTTGDGVLIEFPSVVDAVECAVAVQTVMAERNEGVLRDQRMLFRIGINLGDILIEGDDIIGDGVNIAARLEGIATPAASASRVPRMIRFVAKSQSSSPIWASRNSRISHVRYEPMPWLWTDLVLEHRAAARHQAHLQPRGCPSRCCRL